MIVRNNPNLPRRAAWSVLAFAQNRSLAWNYSAFTIQIVRFCNEEGRPASRAKNARASAANAPSLCHRKIQPLQNKKWAQLRVSTGMRLRRGTSSYSRIAACVLTQKCTSHGASSQFRFKSSSRMWRPYICHSECCSRAGRPRISLHIKLSRGMRPLIFFKIELSGGLLMLAQYRAVRWDTCELSTKSPGIIANNECPCPPQQKNKGLRSKNDRDRPP